MNPALTFDQKDLLDNKALIVIQSLYIKESANAPSVFNILLMEYNNEGNERLEKEGTSAS
jgi:hypothetical protein